MPATAVATMLDLPSPSNGFSSRLPREIYEEIWRLSLSPRIIGPMIFSPGKGFSSPPERWWRRDYSVHANNIPAALIICKESRQAVRHLYKLSFGSAFYRPSILFNFEIDILYIDASLRKARCLLGLLDVEQELSFLALDFRLLNTRSDHVRCKGPWSSAWDHGFDDNNGAETGQ